jgi:Sulfatase-modifying factor enzyme 1
VEKVVDYQVIEKPDEKYFKVYKKPDSKVRIEVDIKNNKVVSNLIYGKNKVAISISPNDVSASSIDVAAKYLKNIGFDLDTHLFMSLDKNNGESYDKVELILTENKENKKIYHSKKTDIKSDLPSKFTFDLKNMKRKGLDDIITIFADRSTGKHFVASLAPPPPPPVPPLPPPPPPVPPKSPLPPVKVGFNNPLRSKDSDVLKAPVKENGITEATKIELSYQNYLIIFEGKEVQKGKFLSTVITQKDWQVFLNFINNDNYFSKAFRHKMLPDNWNKIKVKSDQIPVQFVSYEQAIEYCKWQSQMFSNSIPEEQNPNYQTILSSNAKGKLFFNCRLPTEKEWEIAVNKKMISSNTSEIGFRCVLETPTF